MHWCLYIYIYIYVCVHISPHAQVIPHWPFKNHVHQRLPIPIPCRSSNEVPSMHGSGMPHGWKSCKILWILSFPTIGHEERLGIFPWHQTRLVRWKTQRRWIVSEHLGRLHGCCRSIDGDLVSLKFGHKISHVDNKLIRRQKTGYVAHKSFNRIRNISHCFFVNTIVYYHVLLDPSLHCVYASECMTTSL